MFIASYKIADHIYENIKLRRSSLQSLPLGNMKAVSRLEMVPFGFKCSHLVSRRGIIDVVQICHRLFY